MRMAAAQALVQTGADEAKGLALLIETYDAAKVPPPWELQKQDAPVASPYDAGQRLAAVVGPKTPADALLPVVIKFIADGDYGRRRPAAEILNRLGPAAAPALPALATELGKSQLGGLEGTFCQVIGRFGAAARPHAPLLIEKLKRWRIKPCGDALVPIARASRDLVPAIQDAFRGECPLPYGQANEVLTAIAAP
jgi:hypothetical protein